MRLATPARRNTRPSLIPLIDVMLVLLFFFMLASSYVGYSRTALSLAPGGRSNGQPDAPDMVRAMLLADGQIKIGEALFSPVLAIEELKQAREVRLSPAPGVALQTLLAGWQQLAAGGVKVQLAEGAR
ncbi:MAG: biopolymer transporter ExbD [Pseudomonadota bacterium]